MSTILKALRRLEEDKAREAAEEQLHGEVIAPAAPPPRRVPSALVLIAVGTASVLVGALGFHLAMPLITDASEPEEARPVAAAPPVPEPIRQTPPAPVREPARKTAAGPSPTPPPRPAVARAAPLATSETVSAPAETAQTSPAPPRRPASAPRPQVEPATKRPVVADRRSEPDLERERQIAELQSARATVAALERGVEPDVWDRAQPLDEAPTRELTEAAPAVTAAAAKLPDAEPRPESSSRAVPIADAPPHAVASKPEPEPDAAAEAVRASEDAGEEDAAAPAAPAVRVVRTVWHPKPERRIAHLKIGGGEVVEMREGELASDLLISEIKLSGVVFERDGEAISRRVGE